jgi:hypothetical protein
MDADGECVTYGSCSGLLLENSIAAHESASFTVLLLCSLHSSFILFVSWTRNGLW